MILGFRPDEVGTSPQALCYRPLRGLRVSKYIITDESVRLLSFVGFAHFCTEYVRLEGPAAADLQHV